MTLPGQKNVLEYIAIGSGFTCIFFLYHFIQAPVTYKNAPLFDAHQYLKIYEYFKGAAWENVSFPFHSRILVPILASFGPFHNPASNFLIINYLFSILSACWIYFLWTIIALDSRLKIMGLAWIGLHWSGIVRLNIYDPVTVDVPMYLVSAIVLISLLNQNYLQLGCAILIGILIKEYFLAIAIIILISELILNYKSPDKKNIAWFGAIVILGVVLKIILNRYFPSAETGRNSLVTLLFHFREIIYDPYRIIRWITAIFFSFGAFIILSVLTFNREFLSNEFEKRLLIISVGVLGLSVLGGSDYQRLVFLTTPFTLTFLLIILNKVKTKLIWAAAILSFPLLRIRSSIPDAGTDREGFTEWYPEFTDPSINLLYLGYAALIFLFFIIYPRFAGKSD
jgi:hypothetical protein